MVRAGPHETRVGAVRSGRDAQLAVMPSASLPNSDDTFAIIPPLPAEPVQLRAAGDEEPAIWERYSQPSHEDPIGPTQRQGPALCLGGLADKYQLPALLDREDRHP